MSLTIKNKLYALLCIPLLIMSLFFITSLFNTEESVLETESHNVQEKVSKLLNDNLKNQVDTVTRSISYDYERTKQENIEAQLVAEITTFKNTIERFYRESSSTAEAETIIYALSTNTVGIMVDIFLHMMQHQSLTRQMALTKAFLVPVPLINRTPMVTIMLVILLVRQKTIKLVSLAIIS